MLVLGRKSGQKIRVGDNITIHILKCHGKHISVGIDAPFNVPVHREEIYHKLKQASVKQDTCEVV